MSDFHHETMSTADANSSITGISPELITAIDTLGEQVLSSGAPLRFSAHDLPTLKSFFSGAQDDLIEFGILKLGIPVLDINPGDVNTYDSRHPEMNRSGFETTVRALSSLYCIMGIMQGGESATVEPLTLAQYVGSITQGNFADFVAATDVNELTPGSDSALLATVFNGLKNAVGKKV